MVIGGKCAGAQLGEKELEKKIVNITTPVTRGFPTVARGTDSYTYHSSRNVLKIR
jgi:hypothetical protein